MPGILGINVSIDGVTQVIDNVFGFNTNAKSSLAAAAEAMAKRTSEEMERRVREPKSGRQYPQYPRPSGVSGGYPAYQWGGLVGSFTVEITGIDSAALTVGKGLPRPYAYWLEYGWTVGNKSFIFPFVRPTVESLRGEYANIARSALNGHIR